MSVPVPFDENPFQSDPRLLSSLLTSSLTAVGVSDGGGNLLFANDALVKMWGYTAADNVVGLNLSDFWVREGIKEFVVSLASTDQAVGEGLARRKDGTLFNVQYVADLIRDDSGRPIYMFGTFLDVTEQKRTLKALQRSEATFNGLFRAAPIGIGLVTDRVCRFVNRTMCEMTGYGSEELVGRNARLLYASDEEFERVGREKYKEIAEFGTGSVETQWVRKDGAVIDLLLSSSPIQQNDLSAGVIFTAMDISDRKQAEGALRESEARLRQAVKMEAVGQLAGGLAHDFNNLLMAITSYTDLLETKLGPGHEFDRFTDGIRQTVDRATGLVRKILAFGRKQMLQPRVINLNTVVHDMEGMLRRTIPERVRLETSFTSPLRSVRADPNQIEQVIVNLAINARDAMPAGGVLGISTANEEIPEPDAEALPGLKPGSYVVLSVNDNGGGMSDDTMSHIFEPFFTTKGPGHRQTERWIHLCKQRTRGRDYLPNIPADGR
jgi:PAS domain S-box-containing protein